MAAPKELLESAGLWPRRSTVRVTSDYLRACQVARRDGLAVSYTTDPTWLVHMAINRRAGWHEDGHSRGTSRLNHRGTVVRALRGDAENHLRLRAREINTPRLVVRPSTLGEWGKLLLARIPGRFTYED